MDEKNKATPEAEAEKKALDAENQQDDTTENVDDTQADDKANDDKKKAYSEVDYEAELEKERQARIKAEKILADRAFKDRTAKRQENESEEDEEDEDDDKPLTKADLKRFQAENQKQLQKELQKTRIEEIADRLSTSEAQKKYIIEIHRNRSFPDYLTLEEQMEEAFAIANRKKLIGERNEAMRALKNKDNVNKNPASDHHDEVPTTEPKLPPQDVAALKAVGFVWNSTSRRFEKKLPNGDLLVRDPKTQNAVIIPKSR